MPVLKRLLRPLWHRRHRMIHSTRSLFGWTFRHLNALPLPDATKQGVRDMAMLSVSSLVVHTDAFQQWQSQGRGGGALFRLLGADDNTGEYADLPIAPDAQQWKTLEESSDCAAPANEDTLLSVIIPIYDGYDQSLNALYQAIYTRQYNQTPYRIIVINDASPDAALTEALRMHAKTNLFTLYENRNNLGFVKTVNHGMSMHTDGDVLLLNADTEVYHNWVDRLLAHAHSDDTIASVTPLSNNAEICSYPYFVQDCNMPLELSYADLDALAAATNLQANVDVPTGVGFCMYIRRAALEDVGLFDTDHFGKGYGEENDFCMRSHHNGWKHVLGCDVFVRHIGGTSFGASKKKRVIKAYDTLCNMHPEYPRKVQAFLQEDPVNPYRYQLDMARIYANMPASQSILMVNHHVGGGTERHVMELCQQLHEEGIGALILEPLPEQDGVLVLKHPGVPHTPNLHFSMEYDYDHFISTLEALGVMHVHVHHLVHFPPRIIAFLHKVMEQCNLAYDVTLHDYYTICPRINLIDKHGKYCGEPELTECERCIASSHSYASGMPVWQWRDRYESFLMQAHSVYVPNQDVKERIETYYPHLLMHVLPHAEQFHTQGYITQPLDAGSDARLKIAIIGAISQVKGSEIVEKLVRDANARNLPLEYVLIGHTDNPKLKAGMDRFTLTGQYAESDMADLLHEHQPHLAFIPSIWPETYCYTLSIAWQHHLVPVTFDIGAPAARIRAIEAETDTGRAGHILPYVWTQNIEAISDWFVSQREKGTARPALPQDVAYPSLQRDYYGHSE